MLYKRYTNAIQTLPADEFLELCELTLKEEQEEQLRQEWLALYPWMCLQRLEYVPLQEYINRRTGANVDWRPADEIIEELKALHGGEI